MSIGGIKSIVLAAIASLALLVLHDSIWSSEVGGADPAKSQKASADWQARAELQLPEKLDRNTILSFLAELSDEQVRQLLIDELAKKAMLESAPAGNEDQQSWLAAFINAIRENVTLIRERIRYLQSGAPLADDEFTGILKSLMQGEETPSPWRMFAGVIVLFALGSAVEWLFRRYTTLARRRIESEPPAGWELKLARLGLRALLDVADICFFALATLTLLFLLVKPGGGRWLVGITYLAALLIVRVVHVLSRFLLAPGVSSLRILPTSDAHARFIHNWAIWIAGVAAFGWLTCGLLRLGRIDEATHIMLVAMVGLIITLMIVVMIVQVRKPVAQALRRDLPDSKLRTQVARVWYHLTIFFVFLVWAVWVVGLLLIGTRAVIPAIASLLAIPLYFLLDWVFQRLLGLAFGASQASDWDSAALESEKRGVAEAPATAVEMRKFGGRFDADRLQVLFRRGLRLLLVALLFFWIMDLWGLELPIGRAAARAAFSILVTVLLGYVAWAMLSAVIERKLKEEIPESDEDMEEGGSGGSRIATLLLLLRKFMLAVIMIMVTLVSLSSMGINIGPLIAGAGVVGLAIGFGAQTLVKDIIAGLFFLIDDAFRVGDYVESGGIKGSVEHISLRSIRLRHHRGMVHTVPFGDMGSITNYSRDYIIMKLEFRVRYDTDVDKVRKIIKKINKEISKDEEMGPALLDKIKSQGVKAMDDSAMIMRVKFKTVPGQQFVIRREVYRRMQEEFQKKGIEFAHRNVTVYLPPTEGETASGASGQPDSKLVDAGAAAGLAAITADEAQKSS